MRTAFALSLSLAVLGSAATLAGAATAKDKTVLAIDLKGQVTDRGLRLQIVPGPVATSALRVYSQPSNTLLVAATSEAFGKSSAGIIWLHDQAALAKMVLTTPDLSAAQMQVEIPARPASDDRIQVWILGSWPDGTEEDRLVSDGRVGSADFAFSTSVDASASPVAR